MTDTRELCRIAARCGEELLSDLARARASTDDWSDSQRTELLVAQSLQACLDKLAATECWGEANRIPSGELWRVAGAVLRLGELQSQARHKPRGYAGDFDMLRKICDQWTCSHPLGRAFDKFFQDQTAPQAVRNRASIVAGRLADAVRRARVYGRDTARIVSVGAGPAIDIQQGLEQLSPDERRYVSVALLDMDPEALDHASARLRSVIADTQLTVHRENLFRLPRLDRTQQTLRDADFISCPGLFDYLDEENATAMLSCFWKHLRPGGETIVFNFAPTNTSRAYMEWIGNWYLTYRDEREFARLAQGATGDSSQYIVGQEDSNSGLFVTCTKT